MRKCFEEMIGGQLVEIFKDNDGVAVGFEVKLPNGKIMHFDFIEDEGDCCGWNSFDMVAFGDIPSNRYPVITNIEEDEHAGDIREEHTLKVVFFGEYAPMCEINSCSSSGSGWCYGAAVSIKCRESGEETVLTSW